jgi:hypothetical protein
MTTRIGLRAVLVALVLAMAAILLALVGPMAEPAKTQVVIPPTLDGENLEALTTEPIDPNEAFLPDEPGDVTITSSSVDCSATTLEGAISYEASGPATGPYPGTFTESGTFTLDSEGNIISFVATFTIDSTVGEVSGTKSAEEISGSVHCATLLGAEVLMLSAPQGQTSYEAQIVTPSSGTFIDRGQTQAEFLTFEGLGGGSGLSGNNDGVSLSETFDSALAQVERVLPTSKAQCKNGGYEQFGFKNQGECEKAVNKP